MQSIGKGTRRAVNVPRYVDCYLVALLGNEPFVQLNVAREPHRFDREALHRGVARALPERLHVESRQAFRSLLELLLAESTRVDHRGHLVDEPVTVTDTAVQDRGQANGQVLGGFGRRRAELRKAGR